MITIWTVLEFIWNWSRSFFGTVFVACVIVSFILFLIELMIYRRKRKGENQL